MAWYVGLEGKLVKARQVEGQVEVVHEGLGRCEKSCKGVKSHVISINSLNLL